MKPVSRLSYISLAAGMAALFAVLLLSACGTRPNDPLVASQENLDLALQQLVDNSVIAAADNFALAADDYAAKAEQLCTTGGESELQALQASWRVLFNRWYALANYNFGPLNADPVFPVYTFVDSLRLRGTDYLETVRGEISADIASEEELDEAYFSSKTFQRVGLLALESITFETVSSEHSQQPIDILAEYESLARKCDVLNGLAGQITKHAHAVRNGWRSSYIGGAEAYRSLFLRGELDDGSEPITLLIVSVQEFLDYLQARNVVEVAARVSQQAWPALDAAIHEVELLLNGTEQTTASIFNVMEATGNQLAADSVRTTIAAVKQTIADRDAEMLEIRLGQLDGHFKREIPASLDVELGINFSDGD